ncbi:MAG: DUF2339 domain-containing protein [Aquamicrobium sp.]|nr:DUF2339 domain-containing protein [Aquamicrobium sp.]
MEFIVIIAAIVVFALLRKQHTRLGELERQVAALRTQVTTAGTLATDAAEISAAETAPATNEESSGSANQTPVERGEAGSEEQSLGPWQQAAARATSDEEKALALPYVKEAGVKPDLETTLGTRWAVWVGGLALALGGIFLVRYSIEAGIFGPGVRLTFASVFGILLVGAGELARRRGFRSPVGGLDAAYIPAILTAAGAFTLFGATYAAHGVYGFIGPTAAFVLLGLLALATVAAALIHGQALAGLGLVGSYLTPLLVASDAPNAWTLFIYLAIVLAAAVAVASTRRWQLLASAAYLGAGLWSFVYLAGAPAPVAGPVAFLHLVGIAALGGIWFARQRDPDPKADAASCVAALFAALVALVFVNLEGAAYGLVWAAVLIAAMFGIAAWRAHAMPMLHAAGLAAIGAQSTHLLDGDFVFDLYGGRFVVDGIWAEIGSGGFAPYAAALSVIFLTGGVFMASRKAAADPHCAASWAFWAAFVPVSTTAITWLMHGNLHIDWRFAAASFVLAGMLAAAAEFVARSEQPPQTGGWAVTFTVAGASLALCLALVTAFGPVLTTVLTGLAAALPAALTRTRRWPALGWASAGFAVVTLARVATDPTIAGPEFLGTTPFFNALTPGYLLPAMAFAYAAWQLLRTTDGRARLAMEAFSALFALVGAGMLARHAMYGGVIDASEPTLGEQSIYTLIAIGGGAVLLALDRRSPSPVFQWGSIGLGALSVLFIASAHFIGLNPLLTNESTGTIPVVNLLLLGYLMPAIALAALAWRARGIRPDWYVAMLSICAAALGFAYVTLSVRRLFQGEFIGAWKGMGEVEAYTHSAVWLVLGVLLLVAGLRFGSRALRLASAVLVVVAVAKVFVYDMRQLEGVLRALSFMGLGGVLIGIGMFYQRMLATAKN